MANEETAFVDGIRNAAREVLAGGADSLHGTVQDMFELAVVVTVRTPFPQARDGFFFGQPTNEPWVSIYSYYTEAVLPVTVLILALAIAMILFTGIFGTFLTGYERSRAKRRLFVAFLFVLAWWGIGAFVLRFVDALATLIAPEPAAVADTFRGVMTVDGHGTVTTAALSLLEASVVIFLVAWFFVRWIGIYALMLATPIGVAFWIVDVGPFAYLSALIEELITKFIPLAFITVPAAVVFRVGELLFANFDPTAEFGSGVGPFLLALGFPLMILVVSYYVFFKLPSFRDLMRVPATPAATSERQTVEKGRDEVATASAGERESLYKGRGAEDGSETPVVRDRDGRDVDLTTTSAGWSRPTRTYETSGTEARRVPREMSRSRRKVSDLRRWA
ncbi:MAG: hypothetical protein ACLFR5_02660 [Halobacteriales archaeon]